MRKAEGRRAGFRGEWMGKAGREVAEGKGKGQRGMEEAEGKARRQTGIRIRGLCYFSPLLQEIIKGKKCDYLIEGKYKRMSP